MLTTVRLRLKKNITASNQRTKFNVGLLRDQSVQEKFSIDLSNRFQPLQELLENEETEIEHNWNHSKKLGLDTCEQILGKKKMHHKDWISESTILEIGTRKAKKMVLNQSRTRTAKVKAQAEYNTANKRVKESIKKDKNDNVDSLASQAEEAAGQGNIKELYMLSKTLAGKYQQTDKDKNVLTTTGEQIKRWAEHFQEILNRLPINCDAPSKAEIRKAITSLRNGKAAGPDSIPAEALKAGKETSVDMLHALVTKIWEKEDVPERWKEGLIIKIPKK